MKFIYQIMLFTAAFVVLQGCRTKTAHDASGFFEAKEILISSEQNGKILSMNVEEGDAVKQLQALAQIDVSNDKLKAEQVQASIRALQQKTNNPAAQIKLMQDQVKVQQVQLDQLKRERNRVSNLLKADAATQKQLDDINSQMEQVEKQLVVTKQQLNVTLSTIHTQNSGILSEREPLQKSIAQLENQISKGVVFSPIAGTVLTKYAYEGEMATMGKVLLKIANLDTMTLKVYATQEQLSKVKLGQAVKVFIDQDDKSFKEYKGKVSWVSAKAEFTPKTILTKEERANQVFAIKIKVPNDGYLKIGMYADVNF
ncbi:MAG: HlyD family efflux transporter periplasmic adaptor subunit [Chitinophagaceae bacterium]|nr:HlyD family efflux transporter periplasmic adaptor subunit [Chitinophagaceae bacterium]